MADNETTPILPYLTLLKQDAINDNFINDKQYASGYQAKDALLAALEQQRESYSENANVSDAVKENNVRLFDKGISNVEALDPSVSDDSRYLLNLASANTVLSKSKDGAELRTLFNPEEIRDILVSGQSRKVSPALEAGRRAMEAELGKPFEVSPSPELPEGEEVGGLSARNRDTNKTAEPKENDDRSAITKAADNIDKALDAGGGIAGMIARKKAKEAQEQADGELGELPSPGKPSSEHNAQEINQEGGRGQ